MQNTCDFKNCEFANKLFNKKEECFNYIESWWTPEKEEKPILVCDCAPKRMFLMIQDLHNRFIGVQKSQEQQRNESNMMKNNMIEVMQVISNMTGNLDCLRKLQKIKEDVKLIQIEGEVEDIYSE